MIEGQLLFAGLLAGDLFRFKGGEHDPLVLLEVGFLEFPGKAQPLAVANLIFNEQGMILGGKYADTAPMVRVAVSVIHREDRHGRIFRVGRQEGRDVEDGAERNVTQISRGAVIAYHAVG